jgi:hypothetical protein
MWLHKVRACKHQMHLVGMNFIDIIDSSNGEDYTIVVVVVTLIATTMVEM